MKELKSDCPVNQYLEVFGDKWTLLIIRDLMFVGKRYFRELLSSEEGIATNILADRLNKLEESGIVVKTDDPNHKQKNIYTLTKAGIDLMPIMIEMAAWSVNHRTVNDNDKAHVKDISDPELNYQKKRKKELELELEKVTG
ncbi:winged helix-turn-helix transcriptional regulator [Changchengzhania lutea]|uniref:winged helix-turn-helix transcriptional regulator n=1 Tax=Changchengzhania lutea TaxID=2049305 RepID=UPI001C8FA3D3|nr:helix-turn-helix domain-containing protein [Changchengzhania lutea]